MWNLRLVSGLLEGPRLTSTLGDSDLPGLWTLLWTVVFKGWSSFLLPQQCQHHPGTGLKHSQALPHPDLLNQELCKWEPAVCIFTGIQEFWCRIKFKNHLSERLPAFPILLWWWESPGTLLTTKSGLHPGSTNLKFQGKKNSKGTGFNKHPRWFFFFQTNLGNTEQEKRRMCQFTVLYSLFRICLWVLYLSSHLDFVTALWSGYYYQNILQKRKLGFRNLKNRPGVI